MAKMVNLRTKRKQMTREMVQKKKQQRLDAIENLRKAEREGVVQLNALKQRQLDGHKRDPDA